MKKVLRYLMGGIISIIIGYLGYLAVYYYYLNILFSKLEPSQINIIKEQISFIGHINWGFFWFYTLGFFIIGNIVVFIIDKVRKK